MTKAHDANDSLAVIPWYWRDWRASKARAVLSIEARAVYRELLDAQWAEPDCALPKDDGILAGLAGVSEKAWTVVRAQVLAFFDETDDGKLRNPRTYFEWLKARKNRTRRRRASREANKAKQDKRKRARETVTESEPNRSTNGSAKTTPPTPSPSPTPTPTPTPTPDGTDDGGGRATGDGLPTWVDTGTRTPATADEARAKAIEALGPRRNPLVTDRPGLERECLRLVGELATAQDRDPAEVLAEAAAYDGARGRKVNPANMTDDRLLNTVMDLRRKRDAGQVGGVVRDESGRPRTVGYDEAKRRLLEERDARRRPRTGGATPEAGPDPGHESPIGHATAGPGGGGGHVRTTGETDA